MSQPQDTSHSDRSYSQPLVVYIPIPFTPSQNYAPHLQQRWQQSLFWQMNPLLGASYQFPQTPSLPFPNSIIPAETPPITLSSQGTTRLTEKEIEEDKEFERKKRNSEGNFGKIIFCISYCYALGVLTWFIGQGSFKNPVIATVSPTTDQNIDGGLSSTRITQAAIVSNLNNLPTSNAQIPNTLPITAAPSQVVPVPPPPAVTIATNTISAANQTATLKNDPSKTNIPPTPATIEKEATKTVTKKTATTPQQFKPNKLPAIIKTPSVVKIPTAPSIQIVPPASNNGDIADIPPPPSTIATTPQQQATIPTTTVQENQTPLAMVDAPPVVNKNGYTLMGVLEAGERSGALFQIDGVVQTVRINEIIGNSGWKLVSIVNGRATIARNNQTRSIGVEEKL